MKGYFQYIVVLVLLLTFQNKVAASEQFSRFSIKSLTENIEDYNISDRAFDISLFNEFSESSNSLHSCFPENLEVKEENETDEEQKTQTDSLLDFYTNEVFLQTEFSSLQDEQSDYSDFNFRILKQELYILFGVFLI